MATPTADLTTFFVTDHRACDDAWAQLEAVASRGDQAASSALWPGFSQRMSRHLAMEEDVLFPAFDEATGMRGGGPTMVMRSEHAQMRAVLAEMDRRVQTGDLEGLLNQGDTLLMLVQQHNAKEEGMLYPMAQRALGPQWSRLAEQLVTVGR